MSSFDIFSMALRNLFKRKLRTFLTVLGVVVGTGAIVIMISLALAMNDSFKAQLDMMGDVTTIEVYDPNYWSGGNTQSETALTKQSVEEIKQISGVKAATPVLTTNLRFVSGRYVSDVSIKGIDVKTMSDFGYKIANGRLLDENDENSLNLVFGGETIYQFYKNSGRRNYSFGGMDSEEERIAEVDVLADKIQMSYDYSFGDKNPTNDTTGKQKIKPYNVKGVGILESGDWSNDYYVFMSLTELEKIMAKKTKFEQAESGSRNNQNNKKGYESVFVKCNDIDEVLEIQENIKALGYEAYSKMDSVKSLQEISNSLQMLLGAVGGVSLFIAAIGITNTMIMAIYERTREIGIMKVIGAQIRDIQRLFLLEATLIGLMGGVIGILISLGVSAVLNKVGLSFMNMMASGEGSKISSIPLWLCISALCFSSFIGLISGYFPARRAMKLSALKAIRTE